MHRLFIPLTEALPDTLQVEGDGFHHLARVLRVSVGDEVELFDGRRGALRAQVVKVEAGSLTLRLGPLVRHPPSRDVTLLQGLPKGEKWEWVLQKGTELGASAFVPVTAERSLMQLTPERSRARVERWRKVVEEAARQCGRADVPHLPGPLALPQALRELAPGTRLLVLDEQEVNAGFRPLLEALSPEAPLALAVGPEGGWSRKEVALMRQAGGQPVRFGERILRTETAALAALAAVHFVGLPVGEQAAEQRPGVPPPGSVDTRT
jgi:16S rRNA (uracil1498-N3)-methyltransferase